jgi:hypothetical protein
MRLLLAGIRQRPFEKSLKGLICLGSAGNWVQREMITADNEGEEENPTARSG